MDEYIKQIVESQDVAKLADILLRMIEKNPHLCPHDWIEVDVDNFGNDVVVYRQCAICGENDYKHMAKWQYEEDKK